MFYTKQEVIFTSRRWELDFVKKTNSLMPYWKTLLVYCKTGIEHTNIPCLHKGELFLLNLTVHTATSELQMIKLYEIWFYVRKCK